MEPRPRQRGGRGGYGGGPPAGGLAGAEVPVVENICADGLCQQAELDRAFAALQAHRGWSDFTTTHGCVRLFDQWLCERALPLVAAAASGAPIPEGGRADAGDALWAPVPVAFEFLRPVLRGAVGAQTVSRAVRGTATTAGSSPSPSVRLERCGWGAAAC
eukprot:TRINITY_DN41165_c0_g1_i2.p2 TRINITY_DN41165_c0_g1~~TRINITY_DN41165_c0_g1_i2.p2  ORF type:complete len:160 (+),score=25.03 TRINITY_DN41165_c0_g1_i2:66-545(+)